MYEIYKTTEFEQWMAEQPLKFRLQIEDRLVRIAANGYFGINKHLGDSIWELKWNIGRRIYYTYLAQCKILLLLGGNKNGQGKDINQAKKIFRKYTES